MATKEAPNELPEKMRRLLQSFVDKSEQNPAEDVKIHAYSKHASGEKYACTYCDKQLDGKVPIMGTALIDEMKPFTSPHPPRFVFHIPCLPKFTKNFIDGGFDTAMKKHFPELLDWYDHRGVVPWNKPMEAVKPKPPAWKPLKPKKKPLSARLKRL